MKKIVLLLGGNKLNYGIQIKFQKQGYLVYVVDWNESPQLRGDKHYQIDIKDYFAIINQLKEDNVWDRVVFAYSSIDLAVKSVAELNRAIGLRTISDEGLKYASSKSMMTKKWNEVGILNRVSKSYTEYTTEIENINKSLKLIIKPDNSASSRGITIIPRDSEPEIIKRAFEKAYNEATDNLVVVEEFVVGTEYTVDMLGDDFGNVSVYGISRKTHTQNTDNNKIAVKLHYNCESMEIQEKIAKVGIECYKALGFSASLGHLEVLVKENGTISPVEIGARSSGFIASDLVDIVSGANYLTDLIEIQNGAKVKNGLHTQSAMSSMYFFYDFCNDSVVKNECSLLDFCDDKITSVYFDRESIECGRKFSNIDNDNARHGYEILKGPKFLMTPQYIRDVEDRMLNYMFERNN